MEQVKSVSHPEEIYALLRYWIHGKQWTHSSSSNHAVSECSPDLKKCYEYLDKTSRSFAAIIRGLDDELRDAVCIFYLVLRALDTVEDDMTIPVEEKVTLLKGFYRVLDDPSWTYTKSREKDRIVLEDFKTISAQFIRLKSEFRQVITDICQKMGNGMIIHLNKSPNSIADWDEYCYYVAGIVGDGLSRMFCCSGLEHPIIAQNNDRHSMGIFLQKTNIIRDYLEDVRDGRQFWPREVWSKYCTDLIELSQSNRIDDALCCLNELITNALTHITDVLTYICRIRNQSVFRLCAIPQVMAIATLERCYNNQQVFRCVVKIRKGEAVSLMMRATDREFVKSIFSHYLRKISQKIPLKDPSAKLTRNVIEHALSACCSSSSSSSSSPTEVQLSNVTSLSILLSFAILVAIVIANFWDCGV